MNKVFPPADIVLRTSHSQDAVDRYIKHYEQVKKLIRKGMNQEAIKEINRKVYESYKGILSCTKI